MRQYIKCCYLPPTTLTMDGKKGASHSCNYFDSRSRSSSDAMVIFELFSPFFPHLIELLWFSEYFHLILLYSSAVDVDRRARRKRARITESLIGTESERLLKRTHTRTHIDRQLAWFWLIKAAGSTRGLQPRPPHVPKGGSRKDNDDGDDVWLNGNNCNHQ